MKKWIPYVVAAVLGLGVALLAFGPGSGEDVSTKPDAKVAKRTVERTVTSSEALPPGSRHERTDMTAEERVADALANPPPPPGTLRPQNQAEIDHAARLARPYNKHLAHVGAFWKRAAQLVGTAEPELAKECLDMASYMREQSRLNDGEIDVPSIIAKEQALATRLAGANIGNQELEGVVSYIQESSQAVLDGKDPTTVAKPGQAAAGQ